MVINIMSGNLHLISYVSRSIDSAFEEYESLQFESFILNANDLKNVFLTFSLFLI